jgi:hypothetical protein
MLGIPLRYWTRHSMAAVSDLAADPPDKKGIEVGRLAARGPGGTACAGGHL